MHSLKVKLSVLVKYYGLNSRRHEHMNKINLSGSSPNLCIIGQNISFQKKYATVLKQLLSSVCINTIQKLSRPSPQFSRDCTSALNDLIKIRKNWATAVQENCFSRDSVHPHHLTYVKSYVFCAVGFALCRKSLQFFVSSLTSS